MQRLRADSLTAPHGVRADVRFAKDLRQDRKRERLLDEQPDDAERGAPQPERILVAGGLEPDAAQMPASVSSRSASATQVPMRVSGSASPAKRGR